MEHLDKLAGCRVEPRPASILNYNITPVTGARSKEVNSLNKRRPEWCYEAKKAMVDRNLSVAELARALGMSRGHVSRVINGTLESASLKQTILEYLNIAI